MNNWLLKEKSDKIVAMDVFHGKKKSHQNSRKANIHVNLPREL